MVLLAILVPELALSVVGARLSRDRREIDGLPAKAQEGSSSQCVNILVLGNSLTMYGFDESMICSVAPSRFAVPVKFSFVVFQGAFVSEMYRIVSHYIGSVDHTPSSPDLLVIPFAPSGLSDQSNVMLERTVYHCDWAELPSVLVDELKVSQWGEFLHCFFSSAFANRKDVRQSILKRLLPDYEHSVTRLLSLTKRPRGTTQNPTFRRFKQLLEVCSRRRIQVMMVAMPLRSSYEMPSEILEIVRHNGATLLDMRNTPNLDPTNFTDGYHMNKEGAKVFSKAFVDCFAQHFDVRKLQDKKQEP